MGRYAEISRRFRDVLGMKNSPVALFYSDKKPDGSISFKGVGRGMCVISLVYQASLGKKVAVDKNTYGCPGAGRYLGFIESLRADLPYFLSCGIKGKLEGERYVKTPELAQKRIDSMKVRKAPAKYCMFVPLEELDEKIDPEVVIFFAPPDVISALVVLADFANPREESNTLVKFAAGCGQVATLPLNELEKQHPRAVLGLFDISARPQVPEDIFSYAVPLPLLLEMHSNIDESFLQTENWAKIYKRIGASRK